LSVISDFDIATDLKVEFLLPEESENLFIVGISKLGGTDLLNSGGAFVIGESLLGGTDLLGASAITWQNLSCQVSQAQLSIGGSVKDQLYFQPEPAQASLTLQGYTFDPNNNASFRPGVGVRVKLEKEDYSQIIWRGVIDTINATYDADGNNLMRLTAIDDMKRLFNTRLAEFDSENEDNYVTPYEQLELIAEQFGTHMNAASIETPGKIPSTLVTDVIPNNLVYEAIQVGLGLFWLDPETQEFVLVPRPDSSILPDFPVGAGYFTLGQSLLGGQDVLGSGDPVYTIGNDHDQLYHLCMTDLDTTSSDDEVFNSLKVELQSDSATYELVENADSIQLYGKFATDVTLNTTDSTELSRWANAVFTQSPTALVRQVGTKTKDLQGNLTEAALFLPGSLVGVDYTRGSFEIKDYYTITKVVHSIDVNNWFTTIDTWKEG
jgi:hypothetical protein